LVELEDDLLKGLHQVARGRARKREDFIRAAGRRALQETRGEGDGRSEHSF
jgi:metal-responsive CopG/Arc/MetJ family transcriptional regulator